MKIPTEKSLRICLEVDSLSFIIKINFLHKSFVPLKTPYFRQFIFILPRPDDVLYINTSLKRQLSEMMYYYNTSLEKSLRHDMLEFILVFEEGNFFCSMSFLNVKDHTVAYVITNKLFQVGEN